MPLHWCVADCNLFHCPECRKLIKTPGTYLNVCCFATYFLCMPVSLKANVEKGYTAETELVCKMILWEGVMRLKQCGTRTHTCTYNHIPTCSSSLANKSRGQCIASFITYSLQGDMLCCIQKSAVHCAAFYFRVLVLW